MSTLKVNAIQGIDGIERYLARAWVNFNGTGTIAIRASGNVSSITDNAAGDYTVNFTNALSDANFAVAPGFGYSAAAITDERRPMVLKSLTTTSVRILHTVLTTGSLDFDLATVTVFR